MQTLPDYHLDALFRAALEEEAEALADTAASESQMVERVVRVLARQRTRRQLATLLLAAALTTLAAAAIALGSNRLTPPVTPEFSPDPSATTEATPQSEHVRLGSDAATCDDFGRASDDERIFFVEHTLDEAVIDEDTAIIDAFIGAIYAACTNPSSPLKRTATEVVIASHPRFGLLPGLGMPGTNLNEPAGEYGWHGTFGSRARMHHVVGLGETELVFTVENDCFPGAKVAEPTAATIAGLDALYLEPYDDPGVQSSSRATTAAYALPIGDQTLCVYLTWDGDTREQEVNAAREVVESIRGQPYGQDGIRINYTLPAGWDTG